MQKQMPTNENAKEIIQRTKVFLLDLDGTVYIDGDLIGDVKNTLALLRSKGKKLVYLTNNSSRNEQAYIDRLSKIGIYDSSDDVYSSAMATIEHLKANYAGKTVYLVATEGVKQSFIDAGIKLVEDEQPDVAVLAFDTTMDYDKIRKFDFYIKRGATYIATHPDMVCPAKGESMPDVGSFIEMFYGSSHLRPQEIIGKPHTGMGNAVMNKYGVSAQEVTMVGDRLNTDIQFGQNNKFNSILVLSGEATAEDYLKSEVTASLAFSDINEIVKHV